MDWFNRLVLLIVISYFIFAVLFAYSGVRYIIAWVQTDRRLTYGSTWTSEQINAHVQAYQANAARRRYHGAWAFWTYLGAGLCMATSFKLAMPAVSALGWLALVVWWPLQQAGFTEWFVGPWAFNL